MLLSHLVNGGVRAELGGPCPTQLAAGGGLPSNSPALQPEAPSGPLRGLLGPSPAPFTGGTTVMKWRLSLQLLEELLRPHLSRVEAAGAAGARGPENTFMWQGRELELSASHPGRPPEWQRRGKPLTRARVEVLPACQPGEVGTAGTLPSTLSASAGGQPGALRRPGPFVQLSPEAAKPRGYFGPHLRHLCHSHSNKGAVHSGSGRRG